MLAFLRRLAFWRRPVASPAKDLIRVDYDQIVNMPLSRTFPVWENLPRQPSHYYAPLHTFSATSCAPTTTTFVNTASLNTTGTVTADWTAYNTSASAPSTTLGYNTNITATGSASGGTFTFHLPESTPQ